MNLFSQNAQFTKFTYGYGLLFTSGGYVRDFFSSINAINVTYFFKLLIHSDFYFISFFFLVWQVCSVKLVQNKSTGIEIICDDFHTTGITTRFDFWYHFGTFHSIITIYHFIIFIVICLLNFLLIKY